MREVEFDTVEECYICFKRERWNDAQSKNVTYVFLYERWNYTHKECYLRFNVREVELCTVKEC